MMLVIRFGPDRAELCIGNSKHIMKKIILFVVFVSLSPTIRAQRKQVALHHAGVRSFFMGTNTFARATIQGKQPMRMVTCVSIFPQGGKIITFYY